MACSASVAPVLIALSSDSAADDNATTACVLAPTGTVVPATCTTDPDADFLVAGQPAQSESV